MKAEQSTPDHSDTEILLNSVAKQSGLSLAEKFTTNLMNLLNDS